MAYVYILKSLKNKKHYIGSTEDLERRIKEHNNGQGGIFSKINGQWELVSFKKCESIQKARLQEKKIKSYKSGEVFKKIISGEVAEWSKAARC